MNSPSYAPTLRRYSFADKLNKPSTKGLPVVEYEAVQLGHGNPEFGSRQFRGQDVIINELWLDPDFTSHVVVDREWCVVGTTFRWKGDFLFNGIEAGPNELFFGSRTDGWVTRGRERHSLLIAMKWQRLHAACTALAGRQFESRELTFEKLTLASEKGVQLLQKIYELMALSGDGSLPAFAEDDVITSCAHLMFEQGVCTELCKPDKFDARSVVLKAKLEIEKQPPDNLSLTRICEVTGVGKSWLHKCFVDVHGISPMAYIQSRKLSFARQWLCNTDAPPRSVKDVSLSLGYTNGGRFATRYKAVFGETPFETLARNNVSKRSAA